MRFLIENKINSTNVTVNEESTSFPAGNMLNNTLIEKTYFEDYIQIDLTTPTLIDSIALVGADDQYILQANDTDVWTSPSFEQTISEEVTFISETYRYWRLSITGSSRINYFYLGEYLQLPGVEPGGTPNNLTNDAVNISSMGVINTTPGITYKNQAFNILSSEQSDYDNYINWFNSNDRANNFFFVQFEEDLELFPPYFAKLINSEILLRDILAYNWTFEIQEGK